MITLSLKRELKIPPDKLWDILGDFGRSLTPDINVKLEKKGKPELNGIGSVRIVTIRKKQFYERLEHLEPQNNISYSLLSGAPVKDYTGNIFMEPIETNTLVTWNVQFRPKVLGTGLIIRWFVKRTINYIISQIELEYKN